jgi:hypothetical protein
VTLTIGKVASLSKVTADTLRFYEREGLLSPAAKSSGGYRLYDRDAVALRLHADGNPGPVRLARQRQGLLPRHAPRGGRKEATD